MGASPTFQLNMEYALPFRSIGHPAGAIARFLIIAIGLPITAALVFLPDRLPATLAMMGATFVLEYGGGAVGIGLGLPAAFVLFVLACFGVGITLLLFDLLRTLGHMSSRVAGFLKRSEDRARHSRLLSRYGIYGLIPTVIIISIYVCPPAAWVFGWDRTRSLVLILAGYFSAALITTFTSVGIMRLLFP